MGDTVYEPKVDMHKIKRYRVDDWHMITFWDYDQNFHVVLRQSYKGADIHLTVEAQAGRRSEFKQSVIEAAIRAAVIIKGMKGGIAADLTIATGDDEDND